MRNNATLPADRGTTTIANEVVEKIAGIAARDVPGVYDLGGDTARFLSSVREKLRLGEESAAQGVGVKLEGKQAEIEVVLVLEYGFQVFSVTEKVREKVISAVESLLGLEVTVVDVVVDDIHVDEHAHAGDDASRAATYLPETKAIVVGESATG
ncbi:MAG: Asp23/Gls24 family envelope stress response protein [Micromonosporaceae bacterium]|nr:Asp23/Gls24 family envelope stress response protein [Micromonosporaceae bacterium]